MIPEEEQSKWDFLGYESVEEGKPVQNWFDGLPDDHRDAIKDILSFLQVTPRADWDEPWYDPLIGEGGISEIRFEELKDERGKFYYRIYGFFGDEEEGSYKFLHAVNKKERNDRDGKGIAKKRKRKLENGEAKLHEFCMDREVSSEETGKGA